MNEYTQNVKLEFISNIDDIKKRLDELKTNVNTFFNTSFKMSDTGGEEMHEFKDTLTAFKSSIGQLNNLFMVQMPTSWSDTMMKVTRGLLSMVKKSFAEMDEMFSYNYLSSQSVRSLRLTWGLNPGEAYAYSNVADMMGISSLEDFSFMSDEELAVFQKSAEKLYNVWEEYGDDRSLSDTLMEFKVEMQVLKIEVLKPFLEVLTQPEVKENIKTLTGELPKLVEALVNFTTKFIGKFFGENDTGPTLEKMYPNVEDLWLTPASFTTKTAPSINNYSYVVENDISNKANSDISKTSLALTINLDGSKKVSDEFEYSGNKNNQNYSNFTASYKY